MIPEIVTPSLSAPLPREPSRAGLGKHFALFLELPACLTGLDLVWLFQHHLTPSTAPESLFPLLLFPCPEGCRLIPFGDELIVDFNSLRCFPGKHAGWRPTPAPRRRQQGQCQDGVPGAQRGGTHPEGHCSSHNQSHHGLGRTLNTPTLFWNLWAPTNSHGDGRTRRVGPTSSV